MRAEHGVACGRKEVVHVQFDSRKVVKGVQEEVGILIVTQYEQVDDDHEDHQEFLFPVDFRFFDPFADKEIRYHAEGQNANIAAACLVVEKQAGCKQERVSECDAVLEQRQECKYNREESPEVELRK